MKRHAAIIFAALAAIFLAGASLPARAAMVPAGLAVLAGEAQPATIEQARWGHRGWRGRGWGHHRGWRRLHYGRPYWRARPVRPAYYYGPRPGWRAACVRRGWVWNGWQYVWRRYRVC